MCDALYINYMAYGIWGESIRLYPGSIDIVCSTNVRKCMGVYNIVHEAVYVCPVEQVTRRERRIYHTHVGRVPYVCVSGARTAPTF